ncbi:MAG: beta-ketoacyl-ACP synthase II [Immundisolibacter sp.]|uniref:beta-ketoacyl-ACP synthase II n=1 Tax=Immundisolibacter sp. TaxID=1934948 RepID=UPI003EDE86F2
MGKRRVVVTGLGMVSPLGLDVKSSWTGILAGKSGIGPITHFDASAFSVRFCGAVQGFDIERYLVPKEARKMDPFIHYGIAAADEALADAGIEVTPENAERMGVAMGSGIGGLAGIEAGHLEYLNGGPRRISPFFVPANIINMVAGNVSIRFGLKGPNLSVVTACASATHSIGDSARLIEYGDADVMLAGGAEMATSPMGVGGFSAARALSTRNDDPQRASRPWDRDRDGFVLSDGAGILVLEELEHARRRDARIYAELIGYGMSGDAHHMTQPDASGDGAFRCMRAALRNASLAGEDIQYINAHGTSTVAGDVAETVAIKRTFGDHAHALAVSSTKSMTGHLLGAAGGIEAVFSVLALRDQVAPPTINLDHPGEGCDLDYVPHTARAMRIDHALSNSFGFGGTNGTLVFSRPR